MKNKSVPTVLLLVFSMAAVALCACDPKTETQKTTVIERRADEPSSHVSLSISGHKKGTHLRISGGK